MLRNHGSIIRAFRLDRRRNVQLISRVLLSSPPRAGPSTQRHLGSTIEHQHFNLTYHPLIVRAFNRLQHARKSKSGAAPKSSEIDPFEDQLEKIYSMASDHILHANTKLAIKATPEFDVLRKKGGQSVANLVGSMESMGPAEWGNLCASVAVLMPKQAEMWNSLDAAILKSVRRDTVWWTNAEILSPSRDPNADPTKAIVKARAGTEKALRLDSLLLRAHCIKNAREYFGLEAGSGPIEYPDSYGTPRDVCMRDLPAAVAELLSAVSKEDMATILQYPFSWGFGEGEDEPLRPNERADRMAIASRLTLGGDIVSTNSSVDGDRDRESRHDDARSDSSKAEKEIDSYVSPFDKSQRTTHINTSGGPLPPPVGDGPLSALERCALLLDVINWAERHRSVKTQSLRNTVYESWRKLTQECLEKQIVVPLHTMAIVWEAVSILPAVRRAGLGQCTLDRLQGGCAKTAGSQIKPSYASSAPPPPPPVDVRLLSGAKTAAATPNRASSVGAGASIPMTTQHLQTVYTLVSKNLDKTPYQLAYSPVSFIKNSRASQELRVVKSLMHCMLSTGVKSSALLTQIISICDQHAFFQLDANGTLQIFDLLVRLKEANLARELMRYYFHISREDGGSGRSTRNQFEQISPDALKVLHYFFTFRISEVRNVPNKSVPGSKLAGSSVRISSAELMLALSVFTSHTHTFTQARSTQTHPAGEPSSGQPYSEVLQALETSVIQALEAQEQEQAQSPPQISASNAQEGTAAAAAATAAAAAAGGGAPWNVEDCTRVLACYAKVGRKQPAMLGHLNKLCEIAFNRNAEAETYPALPKPRAVMVIWANARLNNNPPFMRSMSQYALQDYLQAADQLIAAARPGHEQASSRKNNHMDLRKLISLMWSLSVLECLPAETYDRLQVLLQSVLQSRQLKTAKSDYFLNSFERQALNQISLDQQLLRGQFVTTAGRNLLDNEAYSNGRIEVKFSYMQKDISNTLKAMGVQHVYEHVLNNGYSADIYIRPEVNLSHLMYEPGKEFDADYSRHSESLGTVIEIDGPMHFDTYLCRPLGSTSMKHRHVRQSGYNFVSVPYWVWDAYAMGRKEKTNLLGKLLRESCTVLTGDTKA